MTSHCIVCDGIRAEAHYPGILRCTGCGYVYADLNLSQAQFEALYAAGYFAGEEYSDYVADKAVLQRNFSARLDVLMRFVDPGRHKRLLEVGCAYGFFLELASRRFPDVVGVDVTADGVGYARETLGMNAVRCDLLDWDFGRTPVDIACLWDTIEHLRAPDLYLQRIAANMASGGLLAVTTGDLGSTVARWRGSRWRLIHPPTHAHYFSRDSLGRLLDRYGFDVVHVEHCGFYRSLGNIAYNLLVLRWNMRRAYALLERAGLANRMLYANLFDIVYVIARRR